MGWVDEAGGTMSVRAKALAILAATFGVGTLVLFLVARGFLLDGFLRSETEEMEQELGHVSKHVSFLLDDLAEYAAEYSAWDDTWDFLGGGLPEYFTENFAYAAGTYRVVNLVALLDPEGRLVAGTAYDEGSGEYSPVPASFFELLRAAPALRGHADPKGLVQGLCVLDGRVLLVVSRPVVRNNFVGPIRGTLLLAQRLEARHLERLGSPAIGPPVILAVGAPGLPAQAQAAADALRSGEAVHILRPDESRMTGSRLLPDVIGRPAVLLQLDLDRSLYRNGLFSLRLLLAAFAAVVGVTGGGYVLLLDRQVLRRVVGLAAAVERIRGGGDPERELAVRGGDEIAGLARGVRGAFAEEHRLKRELQQAANDLEVRVQERTRELQRSVAELGREVETRRAAEARVRGLEQRQRAVFEHLVSGLVTFDEQLAVTAVNPAAQRMLRVAEGCVGRGLERILPPGVAEPVVAAFRRGERLAAGEWRQWHGAEERVFGYLFSDAPAMPGSARQGILLLRDRTEEVRLAAEQQRLNRLSLLGELSAHLAHELRNPLTAMSSTVQYLAAGRGDEEPLRIVRESIVRMEEILRRFRLLSRGMPMARTEVDLGGLMASLLELLEGTCREKRIVARLHRTRQPLLVAGDPAQLHQALLNILMNAVQAMHAGGRLRVRLARGRAAPGAPTPALVVVADTGVGIAPEVAGRIFDPFFTTREAGTGLGLPLADRVVRDHGGSIRFKSLAGRGSRFSVILPCAGGR